MLELTWHCSFVLCIMIESILFISPFDIVFWFKQCSQSVILEGRGITYNGKFSCNAKFRMFCINTFNTKIWRAQRYVTCETGGSLKIASYKYLKPLDYLSHPSWPTVCSWEP